MGNCFTSSRVSSGEEDIYGPSIAADKIVCTDLPTPLKSPESLTAAREVKIHKKKVVRFKLEDEVGVDGDCSGSAKANGVVRIRVLVTPQELNQILSHKSVSRYSSLEQFIDAMRVSGRRMVKVKGGDADADAGRSWRPALESIPEDQ